VSRPLLELAVRAQARRACVTAAQRPLVAAVVLLTWLGAPLAAWRVGTRLGKVLAPSIDDPSVARALVLGLVFAVAALGAAVAVSLPDRRAFGAQVAASPIAPRAVAVAVVSPVACGCLVLVAPTVVALVVPLVAPACGAAGAALLLLSLALAVPSGAAGGESALHLARRTTPIRSIAALACAAVTAALAVEAGAGGLTGAGAPILTLAAAAGGIGCAEAWLRLAGVRPDASARRMRMRSRAPRPGTTVFATAFATLWRAAELRLAIGVATSFGVLGLAVGVVDGAPIAVALLLGGGSCAVTASLVPLSVRGRIDPGVWVWRAGSRLHVARAWAGASGLIVAVPLAGLHLIAAPAGRQIVGAAGQVAVLAVFAWASAITAGALVPRRRRGAGDDALSLATFAAVAVTGGGLATLLGRSLGAAGLPDAASAALVLAATVVGAVAVLGATWGPN
jgi:hypothetical protein